MQKLHPDWASHMPVLIKAVQMTDGPVLELGVGVYSTPLLHMLCLEKARKMASYDNDIGYINLLKKFRNKEHEIISVDNWDDIDAAVASVYWGVVFIDSKPAEQRIINVKKLANNADFIVIHDSGDPIYHYEEIYSLFKYRFDYIKENLSRTTVLSNAKEFIYE